MPPFRNAAATNNRCKATLAQVPHFEGLSSKIQEAIAAAAALRHFDAGQVIYLEGEPADYVYILESGWIKATRMSRDGREQALMFLRPVDIFGDTNVFVGKNYPCTVTTLEAVDVWVISADTLLKLVRQYPDLAMAVIHKLGQRVLNYIELVEDLSLRGVEARLANTLLQHAELVNGQLLVPRREWATFDAMAVRLGTVRDVLARALKALETDGLIKVGKMEIVLLDPKGLKERSQI